MNHILICLLTLLFSLIGPAMGEYSDFGRSSNAAKTGGGGWSNLPGGVRIKQTGNYWIKEVNSDASALAQWWGRGSLNAQARGLDKLGDRAPSHLFKNGKLITRDAGSYTSGNFWSTWPRDREDWGLHSTTSDRGTLEAVASYSIRRSTRSSRDWKPRR